MQTRKIAKRGFVFTFLCEWKEASWVREKKSENTWSQFIDSISNRIIAGKRWMGDEGKIQAQFSVAQIRSMLITQEEIHFCLLSKANRSWVHRVDGERRKSEKLKEFSVGEIYAHFFCFLIASCRRRRFLSMLMMMIVFRDFAVHASEGESSNKLIFSTLEAFSLFTLAGS